MIKQIIAVFIALALSSSVFGGEASYRKEFQTKSKSNVVSKWLKENQEEVARSTGSEIVSRNGDKVRVYQDTPKGIMEFTLQEFVSDTSNDYNYKSKLIQVHRGLIEDQRTEVKVEPYRNGSKITIELFAKVKDTGAIEIKPRLNKSAKGFQDMVERKFK